ncbi:MAG: carboxymuconolactone decarboxylase family protein [Bryobacteraceae bacterium]|nr:carboxymuconolactone decarboxylase family protein [Bryobacteraceae bacterium]
MQRIPAVDPATATGKAKELLDKVQAKFGLTPNMMRTMAQSPAVLEAYLSFSSALGHSSLSARFREQIALAVAQANRCDYCLSAHSAIGAMLGLSSQQISASRRATAEEGKLEAGLAFARTLVATRGMASDEDLARVREAGYNDGEIAEIIATVALNVFTNYFNHTAQTEIDFPVVRAAEGAAA